MNRTSYPKTFEEFMTEAWSRRSQKASKMGRVSKPGPRSGSPEVPKNIMMHGAPGTGKSTLAKEIARKTGGTSTGYDDARRTIHHGDHTVQGRFPEVHALTMKRLKDAPNDKPRILDNTNVNARFLSGTKEKLKSEADFEEPITGVMPDTDKRSAFRRNDARGEKKVPRPVMRAMHSQQDTFRKSREGREAIRQGRKLAKQLRIPTRQRRFGRRTTKG